MVDFSTKSLMVFYPVPHDFFDVRRRKGAFSLDANSAVPVQVDSYASPQTLTSLF
jgi:hypothetical protein